MMKDIGSHRILLPTRSTLLYSLSEDAKFKLDDDSAVRALENLYEAMDTGTAVSARDFQLNFCKHVRRVASWKKSVINANRGVAESLPVFHRAVEPPFFSVLA